MERSTIIAVLSFCLLIIDSTLSAVIPVEKCLTTDKACMIRTGQSMLSTMVPGIPEYGIDILDPLAMDNVQFNSSGLSFSLSDATLKGIKDIIYDDYSWDLEKKTLNLVFHTDVSLIGHYTAKGEVLMVPITGDGEIKIKLKNMECKVLIYFDIVKRDNKDYAKISKYEYNYDVKDNANYQLTNLLDGNKELSDAALKFANDNWKQLASMFGRPLIDVVAKKKLGSFNKLLRHQPLDTLLIYDSV